jgi:hypothetical protein
MKFASAKKFNRKSGYAAAGMTKGKAALLLAVVTCDGRNDSTNVHLTLNLPGKSVAPTARRAVGMSLI